MNLTFKRQMNAIEEFFNSSWIHGETRHVLLLALQYAEAYPVDSQPEQMLTPRIYEGVFDIHLDETERAELEEILESLQEIRYSLHEPDRPCIDWRYVLGY